MKETIKSIIVDDEPLSRDNITHALGAYPNWQVQLHLENANQLIEKVLKYKPDVIFLDINMPGLNGIEAAKELLKLSYTPLVLFVTAYDDYAIEAFELIAIDYLLKPFNSQRFDQAIKKIEYLLNDQFSIKKIQNWQLSQMNKKHLDQIVIRSIGSIKFITLDDIYWFKASGNYTEIHHRGGVDLQRSTIKTIEEKLVPESFIRVHRSAIVRLSMISEIKTNDHNRMTVILNNGDTIKSSAAYKQKLLNHFGL